MTAEATRPVRRSRGWREAPLQEVADWGSGGTPKSTVPEYYGGDTPWVAIGDLNDGVVSRTSKTVTHKGIESASLKLVPPGSVLIAMYGSIGKLGITGCEVTTNQAIAHAVPKPGKVDSMYLFWALRAQREHLKQAGRGATQNNIGQGTLKSWRIPVPPIKEQRAIAAVLEQHFSRLDHGLHTLKLVSSRLQTLRDSVLEGAIKGRLMPQDPADEPAEALLERILDDRKSGWEQAERETAASKGKELTGEAWRQRYKTPIEPGTVPFTAPAGWTWTTLDTVATVTGGVTKDSKRRQHPGDVEVPYLRVANVQRGWLDLRKVETIRISKEKAEALRLQPGDVLFNEGGDRDKLGRGWVWDGQIADCVHQNHVFRARPHAGLEPRFLSWYGNTIAKRWFEQHGKQTTNLASLNLQALRALPVPLPPLEEQRRIVNELERRTSVIDTAEREVEANIAKAEVLRTSLLHAAFTGQLVANGQPETCSPLTPSSPGTLGDADTGVAHAEHA